MSPRDDFKAIKAAAKHRPLKPAALDRALALLGDEIETYANCVPVIVRNLGAERAERYTARVKTHGGLVTVSQPGQRAALRELLRALEKAEGSDPAQCAVKGPSGTCTDVLGHAGPHTCTARNPSTHRRGPVEWAQTETDERGSTTTGEED